MSAKDIKQLQKMRVGLLSSLQEIQAEIQNIDHILQNASRIQDPQEESDYESEGDYEESQEEQSDEESQEEEDEEHED